MSGKEMDAREDPEVLQSHLETPSSVEDHPAREKVCRELTSLKWFLAGGAEASDYFRRPKGGVAAECIATLCPTSKTSWFTHRVALDGSLVPGYPHPRHVGAPFQ